MVGIFNHKIIPIAGSTELDWHSFCELSRVLKSAGHYYYTCASITRQDERGGKGSVVRLSMQQLTTYTHTELLCWEGGGGGKEEGGEQRVQK